MLVGKINHYFFTEVIICSEIELTLTKSINFKMLVLYESINTVELKRAQFILSYVRVHDARSAFLIFL